MALLNCQDGLTGQNIIDAINENTTYKGFKQVFVGSSDKYTNVSESLLSVASSSVSTIVGGTLIARDAYDKFEFLSTRASYVGVTSGYATSISPAGCDVQVVQGFYYDGQEIEFQFREIQGEFFLVVDGEVVAVQDLNTALNQPQWYKVDLGNTNVKKCYLVSSSALRGDITIESGSHFYPTRDESPSIAIIGDSITAGTGAEYGLNYASGIRWKLNAMDLGNYGIGGSGYINDTGSGKFINRLQEVVDSNRDYLIVAGGINDTIYTNVEFELAVNEFYTEALLSFTPDQIIIVSNWGNAATEDNDVSKIFKDILESKANEIGCTFIDAIRNEALGGWITDDNKFNLPDGTHPNNYMHNIYAHNIVATLNNNKLEL